MLINASNRQTKRRDRLRDFTEKEEKEEEKSSFDGKR